MWRPGAKLYGVVLRILRRNGPGRGGRTGKPISRSGTTPAAFDAKLATPITWMVAIRRETGRLDVGPPQERGFRSRDEPEAMENRGRGAQSASPGRR